MPATDAKKLGKIAKPEGRVSVATLPNDLRTYARKRWPLDSDSRRKERLAGLLNMTYRRVRSLWENEATASPRGAELERIQALIAAQEEEAHAEANEALAERVHHLEAQVALLAAALNRQALEQARDAAG